MTQWADYPRSSWYYKPSNGKRGIQPSTHTRKRDGTLVKNLEVVEDIKKVLSEGLDFYGYEKTTWELLHRSWFDSLFQARLKLRDYFNVYNFRRKHRSLKKRSPYQYIKTFFPEFADKHPLAFSNSLSRIALENEQDSGATCLVLDKEGYENESFVQSENRDLLLN